MLKSMATGLLPDRIASTTEETLLGIAGSGGAIWRSLYLKDKVDSIKYFETSGKLIRR
ncbi:MAG: hypothetical protein IPG76_12340 [Acidobacteria bacterium]|nr:hypothetical protein [Acidobacteriota bacterium]